MPVVVNNEDRELEFRPSAVSDDEIDLVQLTQILLKRKYLILGVIVFCLLVGGSYAFLKERVYLYTTSLQIGEVLIDGKGSTKKVAIEAPPSVKLKIEKVYIPVAAEKLRTNGENRLVKAVVREKKNSNIIFVESKGNSADQQTISQFHSLIISPLIENHRDGVSALKRQFELNYLNLKIHQPVDRKGLTKGKQLFGQLFQQAQIQGNMVYHRSISVSNSDQL